jgi:hypothetical protein
MPITVREPEPPLDFLTMDGQLWEFKREESGGMSPINDMIVLANVRTGDETRFPASDVKKYAERVPVANSRSADVPISVECLVAESRGVRARWAAEPVAA